MSGESDPPDDESIIRVPGTDRVFHRGRMLVVLLSILAMTGLYFLMIRADVSIHLVITLFGLFVSSAMWLVKRRHDENQRLRDDVIHLDDSTH